MSLKTSLKMNLIYLLQGKMLIGGLKMKMAILFMSGLRLFLTIYLLLDITKIQKNLKSGGKIQYRFVEKTI
jgi:hypothetical protein